MDIVDVSLEHRGGGPVPWELFAGQVRKVFLGLLSLVRGIRSAGLGMYHT
jgi:hypothetical protein